MKAQPKKKKKVPTQDFGDLKGLEPGALDPMWLLDMMNPMKSTAMGQAIMQYLQKSKMQ
jgi:hypothetical protein